MENTIYDVAILGAGPAGISAAIYAARARLSVIWLEKKFVQGGQIVDTYEIDNYPGMPGKTGMELGEAMAEHAARFGLKPNREPVKSLRDEGDIKIITTKKNEYRARAVVIACGATHRKLDIPGEEELSGMGVSYCATCDAAFFKDMTVAVVGGGNVAVEDAILLSRSCSKVYLIHRRDELRADKILQDNLFECENIEVIWDSIPVSINGSDKVESLTVQNVRTNVNSSIQTDGVFAAIGITPGTDMFEDLVQLDEGGYICAGEDGVTSRPGIFAAGDIRTKNLRQVVTAVADGANAITSVQKYLMKNN